MGHVTIDLDPFTESKLKVAAQQAGWDPKLWLASLVTSRASGSGPGRNVQTDTGVRARPVPAQITPRDAAAPPPAVDPEPREEEPAPEETLVEAQVAQAATLEAAAESGAPLCET